MNKKTKYYFLIKNTVLLFVLNLVLGALDRILLDVNLIPEIIETVSTIIGIVKVLLVIVVILGTLYLIFLIFSYFGSRFYSDYKISVIEAMYHGFADIYQVYDKVKLSPNVSEFQIDFKRNTIYFSIRGDNYSLLFLDLFGKIEGRIESEFWSSVSKPKKSYNQKVYTKKVRFENPYRANQNFIEDLKVKTGKNYQNYVVVSGFYTMTSKSVSIISPYEIIDLL